MSAVLALALALSAVTSALAQQHRATRLGNPATRFADPLKTPEDLRARLGSAKLRADVESILEQSGWPGNAADFHQAVATAKIYQIQILPGTRLQAMSSREQGRPILLRDVLWAGDEPMEAYQFAFTSNGRRFRVVTPKACSNFWVEELGSDARPALQLTATAPAEASSCDPFEMRVTVVNTGNVPLTRVRVTDTLSAGLKTTEETAGLAFDVGTLQPAESREFKFLAIATSVGIQTNTAQATSAEGISTQASAVTTVYSPALTLDCRAPGEVRAFQPLELCLTLRNSGDAPEAAVTVEVPIPPGTVLRTASEGGTAADGRVFWVFENLAPGSIQEICAVFVSSQPGALEFSVAATGRCAPRVEARCGTRIDGIPAILFEVIDLQDPIEVGDELIYEIRVLNQGTSAGTGITVVCTLEESQEFVSGSGSTPVRAEGRTITLEPLAVLNPKDEASWRVVVRALAVDDVRFTAELTSEQFAQPIQETESTQQY